MIEYVAGFLFSEDRSKVALVRKEKPDFQKGKLNAIGGKLEVGESPEQAMIREFKEETGVHYTRWDKFCILSDLDSTWKVHFYVAFSDDVYNCRTVEDEDILILDVKDFWDRTDLMKNLRTLAAIALDDSGLMKPIYLVDHS